MLSFLILFSFIFTLCITMPYCETVADPINQFYLIPSESERLDISRYFKGYNLSFEVESEDTNYLLLPPINFTIDYPIQNISQSQIHIAIDVLSDNQYQYKQQGVLLSRNDNGSIFVRFGDLDARNGINFSRKIQYMHQEPINCFDILILDYDTALIDCQKKNDKNNTDVILIVDGTNITLGTEKANNINTQNRKLLNYRTQNKTFVLSILLSDFINNFTLKNQSYINTYIFNHTLKSIEFLMIIDWNTLGDNELTIADIDIDPFGFVYLADNSDSEDYLIVRFKINDDATVDGLAAFDLNQRPTRLSTVLVNSNFLIQVATSNSIIEIEWTDQPKLLSSYELPINIGQIEDVQMNQQVIMVKSTTGYYFYNIRQYKLRELLYHFEMTDSVVLLDKANNYGVFVNNNLSITIMMSSGNLIIGQPTQNIDSSTILFRAISQNFTDKKVCEINFIISIVVNKSMIYIKKSPPVLFTLQNPANLTLHLQSHYSGSLLSYHPKTSSNVKYQLNHINEIQLDEQISYYQPLGTFQINQSSFYRAIKTPLLIILQICTYNYITQILNCNKHKTITQTGDILAHFFCSLHPQNVIIFGYTNSEQSSTIQFYNIQSGTIYHQAITLYNNSIPISSLTISDINLIINFNQHDKIIIYRIIQGQIKYFMDIDIQSFPLQLIDQMMIFKPSVIKTGNPRLVYILNGKYILIMRLTSIDATYISNIQLPISKDIINIDLKVYHEILTIVIGEIGVILKYHIGNVYYPLIIQTHFLQNQTIPFPIKLQNHMNNAYTIFKSKISNDTYINIFKSGVSGVSSYYFNKKIFNDLKYVSAIVYHTLIILGSIQKSRYAIRLFNEPTISIMAESAWELFKTFRTYGILVQSGSKSLLFLGTLKIINYQTIIKSTSTKNHHIYLPRRTSSDLLTLPNSLFTGSVANYQIQCDQCQSRIQLLSYVYQIDRIKTIHSEPSKQYIYFRQHVNIIWILTSTHIRVVDQQLKQLSSPLQICNNCICSNFGQINYEFVVVLCSRPNSHQFMSVIKSPNNIDLELIRTFQLPNSLVIDNCFMMKVMKNWLFILDNNIEGDGKGEIKVFRIITTTKDILGIQYKVTLDYSYFGLDQQSEIFGFDVISAQNYLDGKYYIVMVTLGYKGLGYLCYDADQQEFIIVGDKGNYIDLNKDQDVNSYILDNNEYRQVKVIKTDITKTPFYVQIQTTVVTTSTYGCHLELVIKYKFNDHFSYISLDIQNTFYKYGSQKVLNWMSLITTEDDTHLAVAHYNQSSLICSITVYPIIQSSQSINFKSSVSLLQSHDYISLVALMLPFNEQTLLVYDFESKDNVLYNITSQQMYLFLNYNNISSDLKSLKIIASNDYSSASATIQVTTEEVIPNKSKKGIYIVIGVLGFILLVGIVYGLIRYVLRRREKSRTEVKQSLMSSDIKDETQQVSRRGSINNQQS